MMGALAVGVVDLRDEPVSPGLGRYVLLLGTHYGHEKP